uniref:Uncharacterized protein n=1 Tax=Oryza glumipatula TaxID=40148 RepID=A0A0D9ZX33_9ORYZ
MKKKVFSGRKNITLAWVKERGWGQYITFRRNLADGRLADGSNIKRYCDGVILTEQRDKLIWILDKNGDWTKKCDQESGHLLLVGIAAVLSGNHETMSVLTKFSLLIQLKFYILLATGCPTERFCRFQRKRKERCCGEFSS